MIKLKATTKKATTKKATILFIIGSLLIIPSLTSVLGAEFFGELKSYRGSLRSYSISDLGASPPLLSRLYGKPIELVRDQLPALTSTDESADNYPNMDFNFLEISVNSSGDLKLELSFIVDIESIMGNPNNVNLVFYTNNTEIEGSSLTIIGNFTEGNYSANGKEIGNFRFRSLVDGFGNPVNPSEKEVIIMEIPNGDFPELIDVSSENSVVILFRIESTKLIINNSQLTEPFPILIALMGGIIIVGIMAIVFILLRRR